MLLELADVHVRYGAIRALQGISLQVGEGELVALIGSNGAGKSTTLKTISGLLRPSRGTITFDGAGITTAPSDRIVERGISHCPEGRRIFGSLTVAENLRLGGVSRSRSDSAGIAEDLATVLELFPQLKERLQQAGGTLSGGEQQMLAIARALMSRPRLLLLDEPSLGLAPLMVERIFDTIAELKRQGRTILLVEQNVYQAFEVADRAYVLETGRITLDGAADVLRHDPKVERSYLGVGGRGGPGVWPVIDYAIQQVVNALSAGSLYALMAVGLAMVFGILRLINFAHGDLMMIAAYVAVFCLGAGLSLLVSLPIIIAATVIVGLLMERVAYRPLRGAPDVAVLLSSFAVGQILQNGTLLTTRLAGKPQLIAFPSPDLLSGVITIGAITIPKVNVASFVAGIVLLGLLSLFVTRTNLGLSMRAAAEDLPAARLVGIQVNRVVATAFAIGAALAAVAGLLYSVQAGQINPYMGFTPVLKAFIAAVIGGFGSIAGAVLGGYVLGALEVLVTALRDRRPRCPRARSARGQRVPPGLAAQRAGELARRDRLHRPDRGAPRPPAGHPRPAHRGRRGMTSTAIACAELPARPWCILARLGRPRRPERERAGVLAGPSDQPRDLHDPDPGAEPLERVHRRLLAGPHRVHGARRLHHRDPDAAPERTRPPTCRTSRTGSPASTSTRSSGPSRRGS